MNETISQNLKNDAPSIVLTQSVRSIWSSIGQMNEFVSGLVADNKELKMRAGEIEKLWKKYNEIKQNLPQLEEKAALSENLIAENARLKNENNNLQSLVGELKEIEKNFGLSQQEFANKNRLLAENADTINKLKEQIAEYESKVLDLNKQIEETKNDDTIQKLENVLAEAETRTLSEIQEIDNKYKQEISDLEERYEQEISKITSDKKDIESRFNVLLDTTTSQERMLNEYSQKLFDLNKGKAECEKAIRESDELKRQFNDKISKYEEQSVELKRLHALTLNYEEKINYLEKELNSYESQYWQAEDEKHELDAKNKELFKFREDNIDKIRGFDSSIERINFLNRLIETKTKEIESLKQKLDFADKNIIDLKNILKIKDNDITLLSELRSHQLVITEESKMLKEGVKDLKSNLETLLNDKELLVSKLIDSESQIKQLVSEKDELINSINNLKDELVLKNEDILKLKSVPNVDRTNTILSISAEEKERLEYLLDKYINKLEDVVEN